MTFMLEACTFCTRIPSKADRHRMNPIQETLRHYWRHTINIVPWFTAVAFFAICSYGTAAQHGDFLYEVTHIYTYRGDPNSQGVAFLPGTIVTTQSFITITGYRGRGEAVSIPGTIDGMAVTVIGHSAFWRCGWVSSITLPDSLAEIGWFAFSECSGLTAITIPRNVGKIYPFAVSGCTGLTNIKVDPLNRTFHDRDGALFKSDFLIRYPNAKVGSYAIPEGVTGIGWAAFEGCRGLTSVSLPRTLVSIEWNAFSDCTGLANIVIPAGVTNLAGRAFFGCTGLTNVTFAGNAPSLESDSAFRDTTNAVVRYLPGATGWEATFGGLPTVPSDPNIRPLDGDFGMKEDRFGFRVAGETNLAVVVEACTNLAHPVWEPVATNTLSDGTFDFIDRQSTNSPIRFYRLRSP